MSEGLFAVATALTFAKLCFFLPANQNLGPLQIVLGRMITVSAPLLPSPPSLTSRFLSISPPQDILKFICIFLVLFSGFLFGLNNLYLYYQPSVRRLVEVVTHVNHEKNTTYTNAELFFGK